MSKIAQYLPTKEQLDKHKPKGRSQKQYPRSSKEQSPRSLKPRTRKNNRLGAQELKRWKQAEQDNRTAKEQYEKQQRERNRVQKPKPRQQPVVQTARDIKQRQYNIDKQQLDNAFNQVIKDRIQPFSPNENEREIPVRVWSIQGRTRSKH